jgi:hypothetical protein
MWEEYTATPTIRGEHHIMWEAGPGYGTDICRGRGTRTKRLKGLSQRVFRDNDIKGGEAQYGREFHLQVVLTPSSNQNKSKL